MNFKVITPPPHLRNYIRFFWFTEGSASTASPFVHHAFAYPCPEFIFCYKGRFEYTPESGAERKLDSGIYGQTHTFSKAAGQTDFGIFGFYLYPRAFPQLFGIPANEFTNLYADIRTLCGKEGEVLEEKIMLAPNNSQRVQLVSNFLEARLKNEKKEHADVTSIIKTISATCNETSIKALAEKSFLSVRQFERKFKEFSGFSPKLFLRIMRFNAVLNKPFHNMSLAQIAYESGYYDQSHFIHDFQTFSGRSPKEYFNQLTIAATDRGTVEFTE